MIDVRKFLPNISRWEDVLMYMYQDVKGYVTCGAGFLLKLESSSVTGRFYDAWWNHTEERSATSDEVRADYRRVARMSSGMRASFYQAKGPPMIELLPEWVEAEEIRMLEEMIPRLVELMPGFESFPSPAQEAIVDIAWNAGIGAPATATHGATGLHAFGGHMIPACNQSDWATAANACHRKPPTRDDRNAWTAAKFIEAMSTSA